ncbi:site-specific integrase [Pseudomonas sp. MAFF 311095]|uniref:Site-specific integrase n=1 Tax=Pseudomonas petroselini TaxID=2899822 RepID=A0ABS8QZP3_9PSED|nr:site-specific integrase [Pseudomonas petroselini]MCD7048876.1 site-specific integrase [Pseudomonas petroselini]MCD7067483.1 site-specific integrase [Pseudomonas petroselini]MCD7079531.1 site-specific integrase [Pseudomonas petroselini]
MLGSEIKEVSWNTYLRHLRALYGYAIKNNLTNLLDNPFEGCGVRCPNRPPKTVKNRVTRDARILLFGMARSEMKTFAMASIHPAWFWRTVFETFYYTGIRANELLNIRPQDVDMENLQFCIHPEVSKNFDEHFVPIHMKLAKYLRILLLNAKQRGIKQSEQLFNVNKFSQRHMRRTMDMSQLSHFYTALSRKLGVHISPHRFRHTIATDLMKQPKSNLHIVKDLLGHRSIATTLKYVHVDVEQVRHALEAMR